MITNVTLRTPAHTSSTAVSSRQYTVEDNTTAQCGTDRGATRGVQDSIAEQGARGSVVTSG